MKTKHPATAITAGLALLLAVAPSFAKKGGSKKAPDNTAASQVEDAPDKDTATATQAYKGEPLPPINRDDTAFDPSKGKPERGGKGTLVVNTRPSGAEVYYADEYRGKSPITIDANSGRDDISIDLDGWNLYKSRVNVWNGQTTTLNIELKLPLGQIEVTTPVKASISLDGRPIGSTNGPNVPLNVSKVPAGKHNLCGNGGGKSGCQSVEVPREDKLKVHLNLK